MHSNIMAETSANISKSKEAPTPVRFNKAHIAGKELHYIAQAVINGELKGDGPFTERCQRWIEDRFQVKHALLTHSCTGALEMAAFLAGIEPGDEVIVPTFTFTSTANAFLLRGANLRFIDIREDTLNLDEKAFPALINGKTKAIVPVHYAGVGCEMDSIMTTAEKHGVCVIEDAAHGIMAKYRGQWLGSIGHLGTFSFHETKNFSCGEGGALLLNDVTYRQRAEILREKGTNRSQFFRGEVDKYSWVDIGSSFLPSEIVAAFLYGQLERADEIHAERLRIWDRYNTELSDLESQGKLRLPYIPADCEHNAHMFYLLTETAKEQEELLSHCKRNGILAVFHYVPLHGAVMGQKLGYKKGEFPVAEDLSERIVRLPLYCGLTDAEQSRVIDTVREFYGAQAGKESTNLGTGITIVP